MSFRRMPGGSLIRRGQRALTNVSPHQGNPSYLVPGGKGGGGGPPAELRNFAYVAGDSVWTVPNSAWDRASAFAMRYKCWINAPGGSSATAFGSQDLCYEVKAAPTNSDTVWFGTSGAYTPNNQVPGQTVLEVEQYFDAGGTVRRLTVNGAESAGNAGVDNTQPNLFAYANRANVISAFNGFLWDAEVWDGDPQAGGVLRARYPMNEGAGNVFTDEISGTDVMQLVIGPGVAQWQINQAEPGAVV